MTDVEGPPAPPGRLSSVPIRGAETARAAADKSMVETSCDMAQAFEIPMGRSDSDRAMLRLRQPRLPRQVFQIALPGRPILSGSIAWNMGRAPARRKPTELLRMTAC